MFNKLIESTKGYLQNQPEPELKEKLEQYKNALEEKDQYIKTKNTKINELLKESQEQKKRILVLETNIKNLEALHQEEKTKMHENYELQISQLKQSFQEKEMKDSVLSDNGTGSKHEITSYIEEFRKIVEVSIAELKKGFDSTLKQSCERKEYDVELDLTEFTSKIQDELKNEAFIDETEHLENYERLDEGIEFSSENMTIIEEVSKPISEEQSEMKPEQKKPSVVDNESAEDKTSSTNEASSSNQIPEVESGDSKKKKRRNKKKNAKDVDNPLEANNQGTTPEGEQIPQEQESQKDQIETSEKLIEPSINQLPAECVDKQPTQIIKTQILDKFNFLINKQPSKRKQVNFDGIKLLSVVQSKIHQFSSIVKIIKIEKDQVIESSNHTTELKELYETIESKLKLELSAIIDNFKQAATQISNSQNEELEAKLAKSKEERIAIDSKYNQELSNLNRNLHEKNEKIEELLKSSENSLSERIEKEREFNEKISALQKKSTDYESHCKLKDEEFEKLLEANTVLMEAKEKLIEENQHIKKTFKQTLLMLLNDQYIDDLEAIFKTFDKLKFYEEIHQLAPALRSVLTHKTINSILSDLGYQISNEDVICKNQEIAQILRDCKEPKLIAAIKDLKLYIKAEFDKPKSQSYLNGLTSVSTFMKALHEIIGSQSLEIKNIEDKFNSKHSELMNKQSNEKGIKENLEKQINDLKESEASSKKELGDSQIRLKKLNTMYEELREEKEKLQEKLKSVNSQNDLYNIENTELSNRLNEKQTQEKDIQLKYNKLKSENEELHKVNSSLNELKLKIEESQAELNLKNQELNLIKKNYMEMEDILKTNKSQHDQDMELLQENIAEQAQLNRQYEKSIDIFSKELSELKSDKYMIITSEDKHTLDKNLRNLEIECKHLRETRDKMKVYCDDIIAKTKLEMADKEFLIDKRVVSTHFLKYFDKSIDWKIKNAIIETIANIFEYNNIDRKKVGLAPLKENTQINKTEPIKSMEDDRLQKLSDLLYDSILNDN